jgi:hypothetical protein
MVIWLKPDITATRNRRVKKDFFMGIWVFGFLGSGLQGIGESY